MTGSPSRHPAAGAAGIFLLALLVRHIAYSQWPYTVLNTSEEIYLQIAKRILITGYGYGFYWLPGWPLFLALLMKFKSTLFFLQSGVMVIASFNCVLIYLIGRALWDWKSGMTAGVFMSLFPEHVFYSHYILSEIGLEFIILAFTYFAVLGFKRKIPNKSLLTAYFILGAGLLYKHFMIVPFAASTLYLMFMKQWKTAFVLTFVGLAPVLIFSGYLGIKNKDPFFWFNAPLKNSQEWTGRGWRNNLQQIHRPSLVMKRVADIKQKGVRYFWGHTWRNIERLWTPNSMVITNFFHGYHKGILNPRSLAGFSIFIYTLAIFSGLTAMIFGEKGFFRFYSITSLLLLTAMGAAWFMYSRFRLPFLFLYVLYGSWAATRPADIGLRLRYSGAALKCAYAVALFCLCLIYINKLATVGGWF